MSLTRRQFVAMASGGCLVAASPSFAGDPPSSAKHASAFKLNYILGSPMYGTAPLADVIAQAPKIGAKFIDIWPRSHANHREQLDELGIEQVEALLDKHQVKLGMITRYDLGPFRLNDELPVLRRFGGKLLVCGAKNVGGDGLRQQVEKFVERMKPHVEKAAKFGVKIGIENHGGGLLSTPDSIRYFADAVKAQSLSPHLGIALAPYHLPQEPSLIADLITTLGAECLLFFQAWQHGNGCMKKLPKEQELLQLPGRGPLDFKPILSALRKINYAGWTEIFMHPVPRGIPILDSTELVTEEINRSRKYLSQCMHSEKANH